MFRLSDHVCAALSVDVRTGKKVIESGRSYTLGGYLSNVWRVNLTEKEDTYIASLDVWHMRAFGVHYFSEGSSIKSYA